jgi:hypothetical protein
MSDFELAVSLISRAELFSVRAHAGAVRKVSNKPFMTHPRNVERLVMKYVSPAGIAAALLHDVVEDTEYKDLSEFPLRVRNIVKLLTDIPGESKLDAINRIISSFDSEAILIKVADRIDNLVDGSRSFSLKWLRGYLSHTDVLVRGTVDVGLGRHALVQRLRDEIARCNELLLKPTPASE